MEYLTVVLSVSQFTSGEADRQLNEHARKGYRVVSLQTVHAAMFIALLEREVKTRKPSGRPVVKEEEPVASMPEDASQETEPVAIQE